MRNNYWLILCFLIFCVGCGETGDRSKQVVPDNTDMSMSAAIATEDGKDEILEVPEGLPKDVFLEKDIKLVKVTDGKLNVQVEYLAKQSPGATIDKIKKKMKMLKWRIIFEVESEGELGLMFEKVYRKVHYSIIEDENDEYHVLVDFQNPQGNYY